MTLSPIDPVLIAQVMGDDEMRRALMIQGVMDDLAGRCASRRSGVLRTEPKVSALRAPATIAKGVNDNER